MPGTLLIVEDDNRQSDALKELFDQHSPHTQVAVAHSLKEALAKDRDRVDAVLLDLNLPDSNGLETLSAIHERFAPVPVIVLSATSDPRIEEEALNRGAYDYLIKGITAPAIIQRAIQYAVRHSSGRIAAAERRDSQNKAITHVRQLALTNVPTEALLKTVCEVVTRILDVPGTIFMELTGEAFLLAKVIQGCTADEWQPIAIADESPLGVAIRENKTVCVDDVRGMADSTTAEVFRELGAVSVIAMPVRASFTAPEGVLVVWREHLQPFDEEEAAFLRTIAHILAAAMQRNATQEALRLSRHEMERILDAVPERILRFDDRMVVQYVNRAAAVGMPVARVGMHVDEFSVPSTHRERWRAVLERALASGVSERFDMDSADGLFSFDVSVAPLQGLEGPSAVVVLRDITERVRARRRYETLFASNVVGVFFCAADGVIRQANRAFLEMIGRAPQDVAARRLTLKSIMKPTAQAVHAARLREIRERGALPPLPSELVHRSGEPVPVLLASAVVEQTPQEIVTFVVDETSSRLAKVERRNQTLLLDSARDAIILRDADGRVAFWNEGAHRLYGWTREEATGRLMSELISAAGDESGAAIDAAIMSCGEWQGEIQQHTRAGMPVIVDSRCSLIPSAYGEPQMMLIINTDITERKSLERQLLHAQRLETLGILAGGIAHDLNNILMPILLGAEHLGRVGVPPNAQQTLDRISSSARRGAEIIRQLLTFARGHRQDGEMTDPKSLVSEVERMLRETIPPSVEVETDIVDAVWPIACDPTQVLQVLLNLGINARDAMPKGGTLTIRAENVEIDEQYANMNAGAVPGSYVLISVSDTGEGIAPQVIEQIFEPFFTTKPVGAGTGLGLATARSIVRAHGGFIIVYSEPGATVFKVYLPALRDNSRDRAAETPTPISPGNGELILVIDDEMAIRDVTAATLRGYGYRVLTAADGSEGIALYVRNSDVAVVLTDMLMPVLDGPTTIRALRKIDPNVRVIGMSGYTGQRLSGAAPDLLLQKPFRAADLLNAISAILEKAA